MNKFCKSCGSDKLIADRALGGRLFCAFCGSANIGFRKISFSNNFSSRKNLKYLLAFIIIIIILISL